MTGPLRIHAQMNPPIQLPFRIDPIAGNLHDETSAEP
jgi:hypothetical protein